MNQEQPYEYQYEERKANVLCFISLGCEILPALLFGILSTIMSYAADGQTSVGLHFATNVMGVLNLLFAIAGFVLMIYVRVKYPHSVFGKVLMWLFILMFIGLALLFIFYMVFILITCVSCMACISELP